VEVAPMAERTMEELLRAPTKGYGEAIVILEIIANHFEIKTNLLQLVQASPFHGFERDNPHTHINNFKRNVPNDVIKLMMFPYSLEGNARICEAWERFKEMLRACPHHGFLELTQVDTFYNGLNDNDQDSLNAEAGRNLLMERETEETTDKEQNNFQGSTAHIQPPVNLIPIQEPDVPKTLPKLNIPYPSRHNDQKFHEKSSNKMKKIFQIFQDLRFDISFADALLLMPRFAPTIKNLLMNKEKLFELAKIPLNVNCSAMLLKKLPENLGDPGKFLIPCNFPGMDVCHALADLGASINLMPLSIWKKLSLPELTPTRMTLELADRSITRPKGLAEDVFIKVGKFYFPTDFVVVDFEADPRVPLILGRSFLGPDTPLHNDDSRDFILEEIEAFLKDDSISPEIDHADCDPEGDICLIEKLLNNDPFQLPPLNLKQVEVTKAKSSIEKPPKLELKDLPSHLEYAYLEGIDKLPVIIAKGLKADAKEALLKVLKSHKRAIAWKITDIKGIDPRFCTHKILMEEDYKPTVQSQRRVNPKIHEVIKKEVIKLLDAGMIYSISDNPWVSPVHCVPKKGGITVVANEDNELIPTRLVTGWRVCIDYRKLNEATRKDHFPLPFMDQMLERLAENEFYCFLDGFLGYFQILIDPQDQEKTTFTCPYGTFAYRRMPFGLCNAPGTFQRCMMAIFHDMIEKTMEVFMDDFSVFGDSFASCLSNLDKMLKRPMTHLLEKDAPFVFSQDFLGQRRTKHFQPIHYASKTMTEAQIHYTTTEKEMLVVVYAFEKFWPYLVLSKSILYTDHSDLEYLLSKQDVKPRLLRAIISDRGTHFCNDKFAKVMSKYGVTHRLATAYHPQTSGQVEVSNRGLKRILERTVGENRASWSDKLDDALWAFRTAFKTPIGSSTNEVNALRDQAYENSLIYKERTKKLHDSKIKNRIFNVGDRVLLFNSRLKIFLGKLKTRWLGPFTITQVFPYGTVELSQPDGPNFKVNGHRVKHYFGGYIPSKVVPDLQTIPMDN
ncbi:reverse transcriptase domain-containing protein, partial [Tanacetum coccineum]